MRGIIIIVIGLYYVRHRVVESQERVCGRDEFQCDSLECIPVSKVCNGVADCTNDSSDERQCVCRDYTPKHHICDGVFDCQDKTDEIECFGCQSFSFSCYHNIGEFIKNNKMVFCFSESQKCDDIPDCPNRRDEEECLLIFNKKNPEKRIPQTTGVLHRNYKSDWYPVCGGYYFQDWCNEACKNELGNLESNATYTFVDFVNNSSHIVTPYKDETGWTFFNSCPNEYTVTCPYRKCGWITPAIKERNNNDGQDSGEDAILGIVGGHEVNIQNMPYAVAIYEEGIYTCDGIIVADLWILSAAHCFKVVNEYFEIQAGVSRRKGFSPNAQVRVVSAIIIHPDYNRTRTDLQNDIALLKLTDSLNYNRWVQPICFPSTSGETDQDWMNGPPNGTDCVAAGWGHMDEKINLHPSNLRIVELQTMSCTDGSATHICAGSTAGGRDPCKGDSGGPLFCQSSTDRTLGYLAGVISNGFGCGIKGHPGSYTNVVMFIDWIQQIRSTSNITKNTNTTCISKLYKSGGFCLQKSSICDRIVDVIGAEDEISCNYTKFDKANFICSTTLPKKIPIKQRCNEVLDCSDGSDEMVCSCGDKLRGTEDVKFCNRHKDCLDETDEENCVLCDEDQYRCWLSNQCIPLGYRCDGETDCFLDEDESSCYALLANNSIVLTDIHGRPKPHREGLLGKFKDGTWVVLSNFTLSNLKPKEDLCKLLGFPEHFDHNITMYGNFSYTPEVPDNGIYTETIYARIENYAGPFTYVVCTPFTDLIWTQSRMAPLLPESISKIQALHDIANNNELESESEEKWPWVVSIYVNGIYECLGVLLDSHWILADKTCTHIHRLEYNFVTAVLSEYQPSRSLAHVVQVDCIQNLDTALLLHLKTNADFRSYVLPSSFYVRRFTLNCVAVSHKLDGSLRKIHLRADLMCSNLQHCSIRSEADNLLTCDQNDGDQSGLIVCSALGITSYYPRAFYWNMNGTCDFKFDISLRAVDDTIRAALGTINSANCSHQPELPMCEGYRCPLGNCLTSQQLCDGRADCHDHSDERVDICNAHGKCGPNEVKCSNNKCVSRLAICNGVNDCDDGSDEPNPCYCLEFLKLAEPHKICNGIPDCLDKSDERNCNTCSQDTFKCSSCGNCIPNEFVCDNEFDCSDGEDEASCLKLEPSKVVDHNYLLIVEQRYGIWHTKCFKKNLPINVDFFNHVCSRVGYICSAEWQYLPATSHPEVSLYTRPLTKVKHYEQLANNIGYYTRYRKPIEELWNASDIEQCYTIEVRCTCSL